MNEKGIYLLQIEINGQELEVGSLGKIEFDGTYVYVGSAQGSGGIKRVKRHLRLGEDGNSGGHWHIDSLIKAGSIEKVWWLRTDENLECELARKLSRKLETGPSNFGATDCNCNTHLFHIISEESNSKIIGILNEMCDNTRPFCFEPEWNF